MQENGKEGEGGVGVVIAKIRFDIDWEVFVCSYQGWTKKGNKAKNSRLAMVNFFKSSCCLNPALMALFCTYKTTHNL